MTSEQQPNVCRVCGLPLDGDTALVMLSGEHRHSSRFGCLLSLARRRAELDKERAELRHLLRQATDAWLDGQQLWPDSPLYAPYKWAALSEDWYREARKALDAKDGGSHE